MLFHGTLDPSEPLVEIQSEWGRSTSAETPNHGEGRPTRCLRVVELAGREWRRCTWRRGPDSGGSPRCGHHILSGVGVWSATAIGRVSRGSELALRRRHSLQARKRVYWSSGRVGAELGVVGAGVGAGAGEAETSIATQQTEQTGTAGVVSWAGLGERWPTRYGRALGST